MKRCVQCQNELPDTAAHCAFCGSRQPAVSTASPGARTVMGHPGMASELARQGGGQAPGGKPGRPAGGAQVTGFDATQPLSNDAFRGSLGAGQDGSGFGNQGAPGGFGPTPDRGRAPGSFGPPPGPAGGHAGSQYGGQPGGQHGGMVGGPPPRHAGGAGPMPQQPQQHGFGPPGQGYAPGPGGGRPGPGPGSFGPPAFGPPPDDRFGPGPGGRREPQQSPEYMLPQTLPPHHGMQGPGGGPGFGPPQQPQGFGPPPGYGAPQGYGPASAGSAGSGFAPAQGGPYAYGAPAPMGYHQRPETELVAPLRPPYLASETGRRASSPMEPWAESLKTLMLVFGVLLVACFVAPWRVQPGQTTFAWTILGSAAPAVLKVVPILFVATGALAVVLGALPLAALARGFAAAGLGLAPIVYQSVEPAFDWRNLLQLVGAVTLISGLLLRSQYTGALIGRLLATIGALCVLLPLLVPSGGSVELVQFFKALGQGPGVVKIAALVALVPVVLAVLSFLVWLPPPGRAGAHVLAWLLIVWPLVASIVFWLANGNLGAQLKGGLDEILYRPLAAMAWAALVGYGVATVVGKQLEHA